MRIQFTIATKLSENSNNGGEYGNQSWSETDDAHGAGDSRRFKVAASQADFEIDLSSVISVGSYIAVRSDQDVSIKLNSSTATAISLKKIASERYAYLALTGDVTKLYVTTGATETFLDVTFGGSN